MTGPLDAKRRLRIGIAGLGRLGRRHAENLAQLQQSWDDACRQCGAHLTTIIAEDVDTSLTELEAMQLVIPA